jgi:hypothetical protein
MDATFHVGLPATLTEFAPTIGSGSHSFRHCPICGSIEIFDVTPLLNREGPGVAVLTCRCGAVIRLYDQRHRWRIFDEWR